ncbi:hypothetical protein SUDANB58_05208 [Streptomyces sp. enrichment culture]
MLANAEFQEHLLGARPTERIRLGGGRIAARRLTFTDKSYDVVCTEDRTGSSGRLHHIAFAADTREDILRAADLAIDTGVFIGTGPHEHAIRQTFFPYVYEPDGNRVEPCDPLTRLVFAPDWPLITWTGAERAKGQAWGLKAIESFHTHGTPPLAPGSGRRTPVRRPPLRCTRARRHGDPLPALRIRTNPRIPTASPVTSSMDPLIVDEIVDKSVDRPGAGPWRPAHHRPRRLGPHRARARRGVLDGPHRHRHAARSGRPPARWSRS